MPFAVLSAHPRFIFSYVAVLLVLVAVRFGPQLVSDWREHSKQEKQRGLKELRDALERMQQAKRRRIG